MRISYTPQQEELRRELRSYCHVDDAGTPGGAELGPG